MVNYDGSNGTTSTHNGTMMYDSSNSDGTNYMMQQQPQQHLDPGQPQGWEGRPQGTPDTSSQPQFPDERFDSAGWTSNSFPSYH
ncbi:hypothetical protein FRC02_006683 [Tulasnella sp. 418]|nr:hypothetical protein FRC02_006683 [Tulasnella sp. 418]